jgi:hypothetical protein
MFMTHTDATCRKTSLFIWRRYGSLRDILITINREKDNNDGLGIVLFTKAISNA